MDRIRELVGIGYENLTDEQVTELRGLVLDQFDQVDGEPRSTENGALLAELSEVSNGLIAEGQRREQAAADAEQAATEARELVARLRDSGDESDEGTEGTEGTAEGEEDDEEARRLADAAAAEEGAEVAVAASGRRRGGAVALMAARQTPGTPGPEAGGVGPARTALTASATVGDIQSGSEITDRLSLGEMFANALYRMPRNRAPVGDVILASARYAYPEDRRLGSDAEQNGLIMDRVTNPRAIVASGGICAPPQVDFTIDTIQQADRPIRDGLAAFQTPRGSLSYVLPVDIGALAGASGWWPETTDASPGVNTKPVLAISCGTVETIMVGAVTFRLQFGNMEGRFNPEQVANQTDVAIAANSRFAENNLMKLISAAATTVGPITNTQLLGATRDLLTTIDQACAAFRWTHRVPKTVRMTAILPDFVRDMVRADLVQEIGHDNAGSRDVLAITDDDVDNLLAAHGINPIWHLDGLSANAVGSNPLQGWAQQGSGAIAPFPTGILWWLFPEGAVQYLDGGSLDLGVVRDSSLDATNDYETFVEQWEAIAPRGFQYSILEMETALCVNGGTGGTVSTTGRCV